MGANITELNKQPDRKADSENRTAGGIGTAGKSSGTADTATAGGNRTGGNRTGGLGTGTATEKTEQGASVPELAILNEAERKEYEQADDKRKKQILKNARRRIKYAEEKGKEAKPRKVRQPKTTTATKPPLDVTQLNLIVAGIFGAIASRPGCEHWLLTEGEIKSITEPTARMIEESDMFSGIGQYSNQIALVMACITVFVPRLVITLKIQKEAKKNAVTGQRTNTTVSDRRIIGTPKESNIKPDNGDVKKPTADSTNNGDNVSWYGDPIC